MTSSDSKQFHALIVRMTETLRHKGSASATKAEAFYDALVDLPFDILLSAGLEFVRMGEWMPTPHEWREAAEVVAFDAATLSLPAHHDPEVGPDRIVRVETVELPSGSKVDIGVSNWKHECQDCEDVGWVHRDCSGDSTCGRPFAHMQHEAVSPCSCRLTNSTYQRHHQSDVHAKRAQR